MTLWITLSIVAQLINAVVALFDKYIVSSGKIGKPINLVFYTSILSSLSIIIFLFNFADFNNVSLPNAKLLILGLSGALTFMFGLYYFFSSFVYSEASDVVPVVTSISAVSSLIFSFYFLESIISGNFLWGFCFLVVGTFLIARFRMHGKLVVYCLLAGFMFGLNSVITKMMFNETNFDDAFFWSRFLISVCAVFMLFIPNLFDKKSLKSVTTKSKRFGFMILILNKTLAGIAAILILKSIELGDVSIVQSLAGLQFVFLLLFAIIFGHKAPKCVGEHCEVYDRIQKIVSVSIIVTGFSLLFI